MQFILSVVGFIFVMGLAILVHEIGHFVAARKFGVRAHEFAIGMGPILWKKRKGETLYTVRAIPIGGFVMMGVSENERDIFKEGSEIGLTLDHDGNVIKMHAQPEDGQIAALLISNTGDIGINLEVLVEVAGVRKVYPVSPDAWYVDSKDDRERQIVTSDKMLESKPKFQRFVIMGAGAVMNFVLAYVLVLIIGAFWGSPLSMNTSLSAVDVGAPAYVAGLREGDILREINGVEITDGNLVSTVIGSANGDEIWVVFERNEMVQETAVTPREDGTIGIGIVTVAYEVDRSVWGAIRFANAQWWSGATLIFDSLRMIVTGEVGADQFAGFVGIAQMTGQVASLGILPLLGFASLININLGIFNLLPFPALDGGHITFIGIEAIMGKPVPPKIQYSISMVGMVLLLGLMVFATFNDVLRIFR